MLHCPPCPRTIGLCFQAFVTSRPADLAVDPFRPGPLFLFFAPFMHARFVIPGLIWPASGLDSLVEGHELPGLRQLCARVHIRHEAPCPLESWLCREWGLEGALPLAALRLAADGVADNEAIEVCADPASLRFAREHLLLDDPENLALRADELSALCEGLNGIFADVGHFHVVADQLYLRLLPSHADKLDVQLSTLADAVARPVAHFQPQGAQARWWSRLNNELQVFCHNHPINVPREADGRPLVNALWLSGAGVRPSRLRPPATQMSGHSWLLKGLAACAGVPVDSLSAASPAPWNLLHELIVPARQRNASAWRETLRHLDETLFTPLAQALVAGRLTSLDIVAPGDSALTTLRIQRNPSWRFWQRQCSEAGLLALLSQPAGEA